ncbi:MurR/RpiR family transcriptional regulator [Piscinibacter sp.]|uniref:MurR/RpiR family transcriptional regulator n=1 Tax=Piscinibacter sp. TaxID=1903157 RepID=UPI0039E38442
MRNPDSFIRRVRGRLHELTAAERRLADFVLEFPGELASYAASELAPLAGVSNATVTRFVQRLGYASYEEARRQVREEKESGSPLFQSATDSRRGGESLLALHLRQSQVNLSETFARLSERHVAAIVKALVAAPQVLIFGSRSSHAYAIYLRWQIIQALPRVTAIPGAGESLGEHLAGLGARDCVIVFGVRRQTRQMATVLEGAARAGAKILFISDQTSPDSALATWSIQCHCAGPGRLDNHVSVMALCDLIATMVLEAAGPQARKRLAAIEQAHGELDEL